MQPNTSAGKHVTEHKRGKTCNRTQARENIQPNTSAGKHTTADEREKTRIRRPMTSSSSDRGCKPDPQFVVTPGATVSPYFTDTRRKLKRFKSQLIF